MTIDSKQYKEELSHGYDNAAPGWQKWWKTIETATQEVSKRLVELAEIKLGSKVLDIATGIGEPALTAAIQVGNTGHILSDRYFTTDDILRKRKSYLFRSTRGG